MLLLLLLLPFTTLGSVVQENQFIPVITPADFGRANNEFAIPEYTGQNKPGLSGGLATEDIEEIKKHLRVKTARLFFKDHLSVRYFLKYVIKESEITDLKIKDSYNALYAPISLNDPNSLTMYPVTNDLIPGTFFNKLLDALEHASNTVGIDNIDIFFQKTIEGMEKLETYKPIAIMNPEFRSIPINQPKNINRSFFNRLKRAFIFSWKTFSVARNEYSDEQKKEYQENASYIDFVKLFEVYAIVGTLSLLGYTIKNYFDSHLAPKIQNFFKSKTPLFK